MSGVFLAVGSDNSAALLAAMLQRVETEIDDVRRLVVPLDAEDPTFIVEVIRFMGSAKLASLVDCEFEQARITLP
jgi:hypothetical protein